MKITEYKVKREDLIDAIIAGVVFIAVVIFFIEKHRREGGCTSCQQNAARNEEGHSSDDLLAALGGYTSTPQVSLAPLSVDQIRGGAL